MAEYHTSVQDQVKIIAISGRIEPDGWKDLKETLDQSTQEPASLVVVDLAGLEYIASSGFRELFLAARKVTRGGGNMVVCGLRGEIQRVFDLAGVAAALPVFEGRESAVAALKAN